MMYSDSCIIKILNKRKEKIKELWDMKISTALDIMLDKEENNKTFTGGRDKFEEEFEEG